VCGETSAAPDAPGLEVAVAAVTLDTMVVHGRGLAERYFPIAPGVATVVDLDEERGGADLAELLARVAGLQLRRYGGLGAQTVPSIRGSSGAQVQVLVDGLPLADAQNGAVDISQLPLERYATAEIYRGLVPVGFGGIGGAGAVNLQTRDRATGTGARLFTGSHGDLGARAHHATASQDGSRRLLVLAHGRRIDNRYDFSPRIPAAQVDLYPDTTWTRANADFAEWGWLASGAVEGDRGLARASVGGFRRDGGRPGPFNQPSPHARVRHERLDARLGVASAGRELSLDVTLAREDGELNDHHREVGLDPAGTNHTRSEDLLARLVWTPLYDLGATELGLTAGLDGRLQWYRASIAGQEQPRRNRRTVSAFASASLDVPSLRLGVTPQWRWQRQRDDFPPVPDLPWLPEEEGVEHTQDAVSPAINATFALVPDQLLVTAHWHHTVRQPTWVELFGEPGGLVGNRALEPEEITGRDVGLRWTLPGREAVLRATWFDQTTEKTILWYVSGLGQSRAYNVGRTLAEGVELEGVWQHRPLELAVSATWQDARHGHGQDPVHHGKRLPFLSEWTVFGDLALWLGAWRPGLRVHHESESFTDLYNDPDARVAARTLIDVSLARTFTGGIWGDDRRATVTAEVVNVTDERLHDVEGYPLPGRSVRLSLHWQ
jgi:iron complex outermembrane receptor protein